MLSFWTIQFRASQQGLQQRFDLWATSIDEVIQKTCAKQCAVTVMKLLHPSSAPGRIKTLPYMLRDQLLNACLYAFNVLKFLVVLQNSSLGNSC